MAKLGTVFVELSLDDKVYKQKLSETLTSTQATAKGIEKSWQVLGQKSDETFNAQRRSYENALTLIKNSHNATQQDILRAERATAEKLKSLHQEQFGHQVGIIEGLKKNWLAASAAIYAAQATIRKGWQMVKEGAGFTEQFGILDNLAKKYKTTADSIISDMKRAADHQVANADLMKTALGGIAKGLKPDQLTELTRAAKILGDTVGEDVTTALNNMAEALESGRMRGLKRYAGTTIELKDSFGDLVDQLSATEKAQKAYNDIVILATDLQKQQTKAVDESADKIERIESRWKNLMTDLSIIIKRFVIENVDAIDELMDALDPANIGRRLRKSPRASGENLSPKTVGSADMDAAFYAELDNKLLKTQAQNKKDAEDAAKKAKQGAERAIEKAKQLAEAWKETKMELEAKIEGGGLSEFNKALIANKLEADKLKEKYKSIKGAKELIEQGQASADLDARKKAEEKALEAAEKRINEQMALDKKLWDEREKAAKDAADALTRYNDLMYGETTYNIDPYEEANNRILEAERRKYAQIEEWGKAAGKSFKEREEAKQKIHENTIEKQKELESEYITASIQNAQDIFENASQLFDKESKEYKLMQDAKKAMQIAELAMTIQKNMAILASMPAIIAAKEAEAVAGAGAAIVNQGTGDPYTAFGRIAAMTAIVASVLAMAGIAFGGGSSSSSSSSHLPASTVLGAEAGTKSESVSNSFEMLKDIYDIEDTKLTNIYNELRDLNNNITGLVTSIVRTGGVSAASMNLNVGTTLGGAEKAVNRLFSGVSGLVGSDMGFLSKLETFLAKPAVDIGNFLFGGKVKTKVTASGIAFDDQSIADVLSGGMDAMQYADIKTTKSGWFGSKKTSKSTKYGELDSEVSAMFDKVFQGMGQSLVYFAQNLGTSVNDVLNYTFEKTKLDLKDMTAEEMNEAISGYISSASDNAVSALFGDIVGKYQELNEGLMETATRLIVDKEIVASVLEDTGMAFKGTVPQMIAFSEQLIDIAGGLDNLTEAAQNYIDKFYTDAEKFASTKESIRDVAGILPRTREDYRRLVESIDLTSEVGKQAYYTLMALSDTADGYYSHIEDLANQRADMEIELLEAQGKKEEALAASRRRELEAMDESLRPLQELIWLTQDLGTQLETVTTSVTTEINALISTSSSAASEARRMAQTYKGLIETLEEAQIKIFGGGKAGAQTRLNDIYSKAMTGDADALGKMPSAIDTLLTESLATAKTSVEYRRDAAKSYIALGSAARISETMMNKEEYRATLLETQVKVLEEIREDIQNNNFAELQKHSELLEDIGYLLETTNAVTLTGNAQRDVIKNLDAINTSYTSEMLTELVSGGTSQTNSLISILSSSQTIVSLLGQLVSLNEANEQAIAQKEIAMNQAEYNAALSETSAALASLQAARAATASANEVANIEASQYMQANYMAGVASNYYAQNPTAANKSDMDKYMAIADTEYSQYAAAQANLNTARAQEQAALDIYNQSLSTVAQLKQVTNALIDVYNAQYPSAPIQKFAEGGTFGGGWRVVGEKGWELEYTGPSTIVNNKEAKKLLDNSELISEVRKLNASLEKYGYYIAKYTQKSSNVLDKFDRDGLPAERDAA